MNRIILGRITRRIGLEIILIVINKSTVIGRIQSYFLQDIQQVMPLENHLLLMTTGRFILFLVVVIFENRLIKTLSLSSIKDCFIYTDYQLVIGQMLSYSQQ